MALVTLFCCLHHAGPPLDHARPKPEKTAVWVFAYQTKGDLFVFSSEEPEAHEGRLWQLNLKKPEDPPETFHVLPFARPRDAMRPYFSSGCFWLKCGDKMHRVPLEELFFYNDKWEKFPEALHVKYPKTRLLNWSHQYWPIEPVRRRPIRDPDALGLGKGHIQDQRFDGFPIGDDHFRVFSPEDDDHIDVYDIKGVWNQEKQLWLMTWDEKPREVIKPGLKEEIYSYGRGEDYFFLTKSGHLYCALKTKGAERKLLPVAMPKGPFNKLILFQNVDENKAFLLALDAKRDVCHYAEIQEDSRFGTFPLRDLAAVKNMEPLKTGLEALQILRERKLVKVTSFRRAYASPLP